MAELISSAGASQMLPVLGLGVAVYLLARKQEKPITTTASVSEEERIAKQHLADLDAYGTSSAVFQNLSYQYITQGGNFHEELALDVRGNGYRPDPTRSQLNPLFSDHMKINAHDRSESMRLFHSQDARIMPNKRQPIVAALSKEIRHPNDPSRYSEMEYNKDLPNEPNKQQVKQAKQLRDRLTREDQALRSHYETAMFDRAPGQSFRYQGSGF